MDGIKCHETEYRNFMSWDKSMALGVWDQSMKFEDLKQKIVFRVLKQNKEFQLGKLTIYIHTAAICSIAFIGSLVNPTGLSLYVHYSILLDAVSYLVMWQ